ncbi:MAG: hypothetical protein BWY94_01929 [Actinobacteria bacterium ADurb.BinA094]|nr:MAG: hypothetical protein BWY94_01929 [Actinobacteria bacterium ADurb.BinA094]
MCPLFSTPRSSSLSCRKVSASSMQSVGRYFSMARKVAAAVMLLAGSGRGTRDIVTVSATVLPQRFSGEQKARRGDTEKAS